MAKFFGIQPGLIETAASRSLPYAEPDDDQKKEKWLAQQSPKELREALRVLVTDWFHGLFKTWTRIREEVQFPCPLAKPTRTLAELRAAAVRWEARRAAREKKAGKPARRKRPEAIVPQCAYRQ